MANFKVGDKVISSWYDNEYEITAVGQKRYLALDSDGDEFSDTIESGDLRWSLVPRTPVKGEVWTWDYQREYADGFQVLDVTETHWYLVPVNKGYLGTETSEIAGIFRRSLPETDMVKK